MKHVQQAGLQDLCEVSNTEQMELGHKALAAAANTQQSSFHYFNKTTTYQYIQTSMRPGRRNLVQGTHCPLELAG